MAPSTSRSGLAADPGEQAPWPQGQDPGEVTALHALSRAMQGDIDWARWVAERAQGKLLQSMQLNVTGQGGTS